jgi:hypothetical protein
MKIHIGRAVAAFWLLVLSLTSLTLAQTNVTTTGGTVNTLPLFTGATQIQSSIVSQTGTSAINVRGKLNLPASATATATAGEASRPEAFTASAFNSGTATAVAQNFQLQAEPANNNTASPSGTLNLLYAAGTAAPAETGLKISSKGVITFAPGQTFPGGGAFCIASAGGGLSSSQALWCQRRTSAHSGQASRRPVPRSS